MLLAVTVLGSSASLKVMTMLLSGSAAMAWSAGDTEATVGGGLPAMHVPAGPHVSTPSLGSPFEQSPG